MGEVISEPFGAWYHATKWAVDGFSDSLRVELRPFGIDVVLVHPAGIVPEWNEIAGTRRADRALVPRAGLGSEGNEIARTPLVDRSRNGVYAASAVKAAKAMESVDN